MTDQKMFEFFKAAGMTEAGVAGLMGNLYAESGLRANNLQNTGEKKLGMTDAEYTEAVDNGSYPLEKFEKDGFGYGLAQWTWHSRKRALYEFMKKNGVSIGDKTTQCAFLLKEIKGYKHVYEVLTTTDSVQEASDVVLLEYERPANQSDAVKKKRAGYGQKYYDKFAVCKTPVVEVTSKREAIVALANSWLGKNEADGSHKEIIDVYNSYHPHPRGYKVKYTDAWCATFISALAIKLGYTDFITIECSCSKILAKAKVTGTFKEDDSYFPKIGDFILYDWEDKGVGDCTGTPDHIGIVTKVNGKNITVVEGDYSNSVKERVLKVNDKFIRGYIVPNYEATTEAPVKTDLELAKEVIQGKWGNGNTRKERLTASGYNYTKIQKIVNELLR